MLGALVAKGRHVKGKLQCNFRNKHRGWASNADWKNKARPPRGDDARPLIRKVRLDRERGGSGHSRQIGQWRKWYRGQKHGVDGNCNSTPVAEAQCLRIGEPSFKKLWGASLVTQWLRICLSMQGTRVQSLVREDPTCCGATKPVRRNYWTCALEPTSHNYWARAPRARAPQQEKPPQWEARAPQRRVTPAHRNQRKAAHSNKDQMQPKINK